MEMQLVEERAQRTMATSRVERLQQERDKLLKANEVRMAVAAVSYAHCVSVHLHAFGCTRVHTQQSLAHVCSASSRVGDGCGCRTPLFVCLRC